MKYAQIQMAIIVAFTLLGACKRQKPTTAKPNILFIMSDDHTSQAVGAYKSRLAALNPTPTLDQLAKESTLFENAFCTNSICTPSRASIMTGQYGHINGVISLLEPLPQKNQYLPKLMKEAGYQTAMVGKWHLREIPANFDYYSVLPDQGSYFDPELYSNTDKGKLQKVTLVNQLTENITLPDGTQKDSIIVDKIEKEVNMIQYKGHSTDVITDIGLNWLKNKRTDDRPFFMMLHYKAPHDFFEYAPRYEDYLADVTIPEPESLYDDKNHGSIATKGFNGELSRYIATSVSGRNLRRNYTQDLLHLKGNPTDSLTTSNSYQVYLKKYLRCVKGVDDNLSRVIQYLKENELYDNTIIVYTGDQGMWLGEHDYQDKRWGYEESLKMPLIIKPLGPESINRTSDAIIENIDFAPTLLDFASISTPKYMQGKSFKHIVETGKESSDWKKDAYYQYWMHMAHHDNPAHFQIRTKEYKLIFFYGSRAHPNRPREKLQTPPGWELYDLKKDPFEMNNVYDDPAYTEVIKTLKQTLKEKRRMIKADDPSAAPNPYVASEIDHINRLTDEFWDYDETDREKAVKISHDFLKKVKKMD